MNDAPIAANDTVTTAEDIAVVIAPLANDADVEGDTLTPMLVAGPSHGTVTTHADFTFTYTPSANYNGSDQFTYRVSDGLASSNIALVSIGVTAVNDLAVAINDTVTVPRDVASRILVLTNDVDADHDLLTPLIVTDASHGAVTVNSDGSVQYTPSAGFIGSDQFVYRVTDGRGNSGSATVYITVAENTRF